MMEETNLLQKIEYLSRKIGELRKISSAEKPLTMPTNCKPRTISKYWHDQRRLDHRSNPSVNPTLPNNLRGSKYCYKKVTNTVPKPNSSGRLHQRLPDITSLVPLPNVTCPNLQVVAKNTNISPTATRTHSNMYINPHFTARKGINPSLELNTGSPTIVTTNILNKTKSLLQLNNVEVSPIETVLPLTPTKSVCVVSNIGSEASSSQATSSVSVNKSLDIHLRPSAITSNAGKVKSNLSDTKRYIHVNPLVVSSKNKSLISADNAKKSVHVNPKVFARLKSEVKREKPRSELVSTPLKQSTPISTSHCLNKSLFTTISRTKLVRARRSSLHRSLSNQHTPRARVLSVSKPIPSPLVKIVKSVRSKYKYIRKHSSTPGRMNIRSLSKVSPFLRTKYKLDRRLQKTPKCIKKVQKYSLKYETDKQNKIAESNLQGILLHKRLSSVTKSPFGNRVWGAGSFQLQKVIITDQKLLKIGSTPNVKRNSKIVNRPTSTSSTLVRIGGVLYKTSRTKLTRTSSTTPKIRKSRLIRSLPVVKKFKGSGGHVVHVRGNKFLMDPSGKTLRRFSSCDSSGHGQMKRIDIGGATFVQKSANILIRTNTHAVRSMLSQAKQKSIDLLTKKMRKNNTFCKFYRRFGKCFREEKGRCPCVHDKKYVAICKRYLNGECTKETCRLSHDLIPEKMPTCKYFLQACCSRDTCPYLHVKLNPKAPLCIAFLQGYCIDGRSCRKWHFYICPQYDKTGKCPKSKYCPFPHEPRKHTELNRDHLEVNVERILKLYGDRQRELREGKLNPEKTIRYFNFNSEMVNEELSRLQLDSASGNSGEEHSEVEEMSTANSSTAKDYNRHECCDVDIDPLPRRLKIGFLPSYIPLN